MCTKDNDKKTGQWFSKAETMGHYSMSTCSMAFVDNTFADQMGIPEATFSNPFSTWAMFLSKELAQLLPLPSQVQNDSWMPPTL